jgi:hypothetical protein
MDVRAGVVQGIDSERGASDSGMLKGFPIGGGVRPQSASGWRRLPRLQQSTLRRVRGADRSQLNRLTNTRPRRCREVMKCDSATCAGGNTFLAGSSHAPRG